MKTRRHALAALLGAALALPGCEILDTGAPTLTHITLRLDLDPEALTAGDTAIARVQVINTGVYDPMTISGSGTCFAKVEMTRDGAPQDFKIEPDPCWRPTLPMVLQPGDTARHEFDVIATSGTGQPAAAGSYILYLTFDGRVEGGSRLSQLAHPLTVN